MSDQARPDPESRREQALRGLGTRSPKCTQCDERDPIALTGTHPDILCYRHRRIGQGKSPEEDHHPAGKANSPLRIRTDGNEHRLLSDKQRDWPDETLRNPDGSPLLKVAALVRSWIDYLRLLLERGVGRIPPALEALDRLLRQYIGPRWWDVIGWEF